MIAARLAFFYAAYFFVAGVSMSYWPVWLAHREVGTVETGTLYMAGQIATVLAILAVGMLAGRLQAVRKLLIALALAATLSAAAFEFAWGFWPNLGVMLAWSLMWHPILTLGDGIGVTVTRQRHLDYARVRLWGSISFIGGATVVALAVERWGARAVLPVMVTGVVLTIAGVLLLPRPASEGSAPVGGRLQIMRRLLRNRAFLLFLLAAGSLQASHAILTLFATLSWRGLGIADSTISLLWGASIVAEVGLFSIGGVLVRRIGATGLLTCAAIAGLLRWSAMPFGSDVAVIAALQALHAFTYGATHLGAMAFLQRTLDAAQMAAGQSLYYALATGLLALMLQLGGVLFDQVGVQAYLAMALLSGVALVASWRLAQVWRGEALAR